MFYISLFLSIENDHQKCLRAELDMRDVEEMMLNMLKLLEIDLGSQARTQHVKST
jgi:hypothetical protein